MHTRKTKGRRAKGLTPTQTLILQAAAASPGGIIYFNPGDRLGTRVSSYDDDGHPRITAYGTPQFFMVARKLLVRGNDSRSYQITDAGLNKVNMFKGRPL
jgi:uncharacterized protein YjhX (UPF0386 family)